MIYNIELKEEVRAELKKLSKQQQVLITKQFIKISKSPELGHLLGNKNGYNLSGCRKMYVDNKKIRIVYRIIDDKIVVEVVAIGKREDMQVYKNASQRL